MSDNPDTTTNVTRRTFLGRAAAAGLLATPAAGVLSACVGSGGEKQKQAEGQKSTENPLGIKEDAPVEIVIFNGGLGTKYATDVHVPSYEKKWPKSKVNFSQTEEISTVLQPRFSSNTPPDMVNNAGSKNMDTGALVQAGQIAELGDLYDAPSLDISGKKVRDTLVPGTIEQGTFNGKPYVLNYTFTVFGMWYDSALFEQKGWEPAKTWSEFTALCDKIKAANMIPFSYAGANAGYYMTLLLLTSAAKIGGADVLKNIDNLEDGAWKVDAVKQAAAAWAEVGAKFGNKAHLGLRHTEVQLQQNQGKIAFYPSGSWLENEQAKSTPGTFKYAVTPTPSVTGSDKLPFTAIYAAAGEEYFAAAKGKNPQGAKEYLRHMLSKAGALEFTKLTKVLTVVQGATEGVEISPGLTSGNKMLTAAGANTFSYRFESWYKKLDEEARAAANELFFSGGNADKYVDRMQKVADAVKKDDTIKKFKR